MLDVRDVERQIEYRLCNWPSIHPNFYLKHADGTGGEQLGNEVCREFPNDYHISFFVRYQERYLEIGIPKREAQ